MPHVITREFDDRALEVETNLASARFHGDRQAACGADPRQSTGGPDILSAECTKVPVHHPVLKRWVNNMHDSKKKMFIKTIRKINQHKNVKGKVELYWQILK